MNADQVRALVAAKWPEAMQSPVAAAIAQISAQDEVDNLGLLLADISRLTTEADAIKARLKKAGFDKYHGDMFTATVVQQERTTYDPRKVEVMLGDKVSLVEKTITVTKVMVTARQAA